MSGGIIATLSLAACVPAYIVGTIGNETLKIVGKSSVAAYEQFNIASEYKDEIKALVRDYQSRCVEHAHESNLIRSQIRNSTENEINRLISKLRSEGCRDFELVIDGSSEEKLIKLIALELEYSGRKVDEIRSPEELYRSICEMTNRWLAVIPEGFTEYAEIEKSQNQAKIIATDASLLASDKSIKLKKLETDIINGSFTYDRVANKCRSQLAEFMGLKVTVEKISSALDETFTVPEYSPVNAEKQIEDLSIKVSEFRDKLREKALTDEEFLSSNKILADAVINSVEEAGYKRIKKVSEEYGEKAIFEYQNSLLNVIVSREGRLSMNIVGKQGESKELIYADEELFCQKGIEKINKRFEENGIRMNIEIKAKLSDDSIIYTVVDSENSGSHNGTSQPARRTMYINRDGRTVIQ